jgi:hypothetical protein
MSKMPDSNSTPTKAANGAVLPPLSPKHLDHPQSWATGGEAATNKQKGFVKSLESQHDIAEGDKVDTAHLSKTDASIAIDHLKKGEPGNVDAEGEGAEEKAEKQEEDTGDDKDEESNGDDDDDEKEKKKEEKKKTPSTPKKASQAGDASDPIQVDSEPSSPSASSKRKHTTSPEAKRARADAIKSAKDTEEPEPKKARTDGDDDLVEGVKAHDGTVLPPLSPDHLDKPNQWATGGDPPTAKQKTFIRSLEQQKGEEHVEVQGKSEASERIDELKNQ